MKRTAVLAAAVLMLAGCMTLGPPPAIHIESPSPQFSTDLTLDERIAVEDAWTALKRGNIEKARKLLLKLSPENPFAAVGFGYAALVENDLPTAEEYFLGAVRDIPALPLGYLGLGQVYQTTGQTDLAYKYFLETLKRNPENEYARNASEEIRAAKTAEYLDEARNAAALGDFERSKEAYLKALEFSPKLQDAHLGIAQLYIREKSYQNALLHLRMASGNDPKNTAILLDYAETLFLAGQLSRSLDAYNRVLELDPQNKLARDRTTALRNKLGVVELPSQFNAIVSLEAVAREDVAALIGIKFKEVLDEQPPRTPVIVDITTSWALQHIVKVASFDIMSVNSNRTFEPKKTVTRGEMAEILVRLAAFLKKHDYKVVEQVPAERIRIADVTPEHFYYQPIVQAISYQLMGLGPDRTFKPDLLVSGREAVRATDLLLGLIK